MLKLIEKCTIQVIVEDVCCHNDVGLVSVPCSGVNIDHTTCILRPSPIKPNQYGVIPNELDFGGQMCECEYTHKFKFGLVRNRVLPH